MPDKKQVGGVSGVVKLGAGRAARFKMFMNSARTPKLIGLRLFTPIDNIIFFSARGCVNGWLKESTGARARNALDCESSYGSASKKCFPLLTGSVNVVHDAC